MDTKTSPFTNNNNNNKNAQNTQYCFVLESFFFLAVPEHPDQAPWAESWTADALILAAGEGSIFPLPSKVTELQILGFSE